jgi:hypothetical protein
MTRSVKRGQSDENKGIFARYFLQCHFLAISRQKKKKAGAL